MDYLYVGFSPSSWNKTKIFMLNSWRIPHLRQFSWKNTKEHSYPCYRTYDTYFYCSGYLLNWSPLCAYSRKYTSWCSDIPHSVEFILDKAHGIWSGSRTYVWIRSWYIKQQKFDLAIRAGSMLQPILFSQAYLRGYWLQRVSMVVYSYRRFTWIHKTFWRILWAASWHWQAASYLRLLFLW